MNTGLTLWGFVTYGVRSLRGKALALAFVLSAPIALAEQVTLVAVGDSLTQGYGLMEQDGFVPQMRRWLDGQGADVRLINAGVSGDTTTGGLARIDWALTEEVQGMILALGGNDVLRGTDPALVRSNIRGMLQVAQDKGVEVLLIGTKAPSNFGPDYVRDLNALWPDLSAEFDTLYAESFFLGFGDKPPAELRQVLQPDGLHPTAEGMAQIVAALGPYVEELIGRVD